MNATERIFRVFYRFSRFIREKHRKAWNGISILVHEDNSASEPRRYRINYYVIFFFFSLIVWIPLFAIGNFTHRRFFKENPLEVLENRQLLLNSFKLVHEKKEKLLNRAYIQIQELESLNGEEHRSLLDGYLRQRMEEEKQRVGSVTTDKIRQDLNKLKVSKSYFSLLNNAIYYSLNTLWNRIEIHAIMPRNRPVPSGEGRISSLFGHRIDPFSVLDGHGGAKGGTGEFHSGVDFAAMEGLPILATAPGEVIQVQYENFGEGYGRYIRIHHGLGIITIYAHCLKIFVKTGDIVKRGQVIGLIGQTGRATGAHVHYEVRMGESAPLDPMPFVRLK